MTFADSYFQKCHQLMNENSKLRRRIMQLELEIRDLKKENELLKQDLEHCANQFKDGKNVLLGL